MKGILELRTRSFVGVPGAKGISKSVKLLPGQHIPGNVLFYIILLLVNNIIFSSLSPYFIRDVRPKYDCTLEKSQDDCLKAIKEDNADLTVVSGGSVLRATKEYNAVPIIAESYGPGSTNFNERPAVAVVSKSSSINKLGKKWHSVFL